MSNLLKYLEPCCDAQDSTCAAQNSDEDHLRPPIYTAGIRKYPLRRWNERESQDCHPILVTALEPTPAAASSDASSYRRISKRRNLARFWRPCNWHDSRHERLVEAIDTVMRISTQVGGYRTFVRIYYAVTTSNASHHSDEYANLYLIHVQASINLHLVSGAFLVSRAATQEKWSTQRQW